MHPLWLAIRLPQLPREVLSPPDRSTRGQASATEATPRNPRAEREAVKALCAAAYQFSGTVTAQARAPQPTAHTIWLEVGTSLRLFGGLDALIAKLDAVLSRIGYSHQFGVAPTLEGASILCGSGIFCGSGFSRDELLTALKDLPASRLPLPKEVLASLDGSGLTRIGQVLAVPLDAVAMRFGYETTDYFGRLTGRLADPRRWYRIPERYRRRFEFDGEIEATETLLFPLRRMLAEFHEYLVARDTGVQEFRIELEHEDPRQKHSGAGASASVLTLGLSSPSRDAAHFGVLVRERFERTPLAGPVTAMTLAADRFVSPRVRQLDFLNPRGREDDEWDALLDRLRSRLGPEMVHSLGLAADYRPEKSWCSVPVGAVPVGAASAATDPRRPLWLFPEPQPLDTMPRCVSGPERIEGGWWDGLDATRDYYVAESGAGARLWVYRERGSGGWFLQGLWS